jgi:ferredoxin-NADP reductase
MSAPFEERVLDVRHWTDSLFSFTTTRNAACRFKNGQFVMLGLEVDGRPLMRAYSIASPNQAEELEFFSIKVQNGPLTSRLQHLSVGDSILIGRKPTGTLVLDICAMAATSTFSPPERASRRFSPRSAIRRLMSGSRRSSSCTGFERGRSLRIAI